MITFDTSPLVIEIADLYAALEFPPLGLTPEEVEALKARNAQRFEEIDERIKLMGKMVRNIGV